LFIVVGAVAASFYWLWQTSPPDPRGEEKIFVINRGEPTSEIARRLEKDGLIRSKFVFLAVVYQQGLMGKAQAGSFRLSPAMASGEIARLLTKGRLDQWLTVVEGLRREEIAQLAERELSIPVKEFLAASKGKEGYLFPDSYLVPLGATAEKLVTMMERNFKKKTENTLPLAQRKGLNINQWITLASLVEREAKNDRDRALVAGIMIKRWENGWPLQVDATVQYAKATVTCREKADCRWWPPVGGADLKMNSPYNTYRQLGLPPGPICNPSLSSLKAVADYQLSDYWFYLSDSQGKIHFSTSLKEHKQKIAQYLD